MRTSSLRFALILLAPAGLLWSQANPPAAPAAATPSADKPAGDAVTIKGTEPTGAGASRSHDTLSVDFPDEDIRTILRNVADLFELNLVIPDTLQGKTSIKLRNVTWRQIFEVILSPVGYTYIEDGSIIKIVSLESLAQEPASTEVFTLNYARAADVQPVISSLVDSAAGGKLVVDTRSNSLIITERPSKMNKIRPIIQQLDKATDQVMIESKFVEVTNSDIKNIGVNWASLSGFQLGVGSMSQTFSRSRGQTLGPDGFTNSTTSTTNVSNGGTNTATTTNTGATNTSTTQTNSGSQLATNAQTGLPQVVQVASNGTTTTSTTPSSQTISTTGTNDANTTALTTALGLMNAVSNTGDTSRLASAVFSASDFNVVLSALKTLNQVKIVSNPTVVTLNNSEAFINVGEEYPIPSYTYNQEHGSFEVSGFTYKPIGIILRVTPQVNARGFIKLTLEPEVSQQNGTTTFGGAGGASIPIIATRTAKTQVSMKDGYTMAIGGLMRTQTTTGGTKVPVLGSIPLLGHLFRSDTKDSEVTNLIIFITAKAINAEGAPPEEVMSPSQLRGLGMRRDELPGYRESTDPFLPAAKAGDKSGQM
ncbi:MAG TPA: secretin N-terminal domain-containing protein [Opitutaceae bacterium]|nr:secretin N-terminal domain-containing protein [Opitutaceae bacterium]